MLEIMNISLSRSGSTLLRNVCATFNDGEIIGIAGRPGAGKSLLLGIIAGLVKPGMGQVIINGNPMDKTAGRKRRTLVSLTGDAFPENRHDRVKDFLLLSRAPHRRIFRAFAENDLDTVDMYIELFNLSGYRDCILGDLPGSVLQRVVTAFGFIREAHLLLMDEPQKSLDIASVRMLCKIMSRYVINGKRIIAFCSNDLNFISQTADRILIMHGGSIVEDGGPEIISTELVSKYFNTDVFLSRNIYNGRPEIHFFPEN